MRHARRFLVAFTVAFALAGAGTAGAYHTQFVAQNCNYAAPTPTSYITRDGSITVALYARYEGYQWGGGCWNDNDVDDSPGDPSRTRTPAAKAPTAPDSRSRSGASRWTKAARPSTSGGGSGTSTARTPRSDSRMRDGAPNYPLSKSAAIKMDAYASATHIGMIYATNADGTDQIIEAKGESYGTNIWTRAYRGNSIYSGVRRLGWSQP